MGSLLYDDRLIGPIAGDVAVGRDVTYEPQFQALQAEVEQATGLAAKSVDWHRVQQESARLLTEESKDLRLASWWCVAAANLDGWAGLARGLALYQAMLETHWEGMFPTAKRARARAGLVEWVWEGSRKALSAREITPADVTTVQESLTSLGNVDRALAERLGELNPGAGSLRSLLREKAESVAVPPPAPPAPAPTAQVTATPGLASPTAAPQAVAPVASAAANPSLAVVEAPTVSSREDVERVTTQWQDRLSALAVAARTADPTMPLSYRLARLAAWLTIEGPPDAEGGKTFIRAPRPADVRDLRTLFESGQWAMLRDAAEGTLSEHIFWLDLHYMTYAALDRLGATYAPARATVLHETLTFLDRLPTLESLQFVDGTPFATADTIAWIKAKRSRGTASQGAASGAPDDAVTAIVAAASAACADGRVADALAEGLAQARNLPFARQRFRARLDVAGLALSEGRKEVGLSVLEQLIGEIDASIEAWEPGMCAEAISGLLTARAFRAETATLEEERLLFRRLLQLDPVSALRLGGQ